MAKRSLHNKYMLTIGSIILIIVVLLTSIYVKLQIDSQKKTGIYLEKASQDLIESRIPKDTAKLEHLLKADLSWSIYSYNFEKIQEILKEDEKFQKFNYFYIEDIDGELIYSLNQGNNITKELRSSYKDKIPEKSLGKNYVLKGNELHYQMIAEVSNVKAGKIYFSISYETEIYYVNQIKTEFLLFEQSERGKFFLLISISLILIIIVSFLLIYLVTKKIVKPIKEIESISREITNKNYEISFKLERDDEIGSLSKSLEKMRLELVEQHKYIYNLAYQDTLTKLDNRRYFYENYIPKIKDVYKKSIVLLIDIDNFKSINDTLGHDSGDIALVQLSEKLKRGMPENSMIARLGGDEFVASFPYETKKQLKEIIENFKKILSEPIKLGRKMYELTCSVGIVVIKKADKIDISEILKKADIAMYFAKESGKNQMSVFTPKKGNEHKRENLKARKIMLALENKDFFMVYHPYYDIISEEICGYEGLIRWEKSENEVGHPNDFLPYIEKLGLQDKLAKIVLDKVCRNLDKFDKDKKISINISGSVFNTEKFYNEFLSILKETNTNPERLMLEISEESYISNKTDISKTLKKFKDLGVEIWIDNFGTNSLSLFNLRNLKVTGVKIDKKFIDELETSKEAYRLLKGVAHLATSLNLKIIIEGVESQIQYDLLKKLQIEIIQGFYICKPIKLKEVNRIQDKINNIIIN